MHADKHSFLISLGEEIRITRNNLKLSQEAFADKCGFDRTYISLLERGRRNPSVYNLKRICDGLQLTLGALLRGVK